MCPRFRGQGPQDEREQDKTLSIRGSGTQHAVAGRAKSRT